MRVRRGLTAMLAIVLAIVLVGCASDVTSTPTIPTTPSVAPDTTDNTSTSTDGTTSTVAATTSPTESTPAEVDGLAARFTVADLPTGAPCAMVPVPSTGQTTFVMDGKLWALNVDDSIACLADLQGRNPSWISWSPDGDEVLVGPDTVLRNDGTFVPTGYFPDNRSLRWSAPTGKALLAPNAATGKLIWRNAHDSGDRIDVSFAERTTTAAYHPAGKHIAAAGTGSDGLGEGVFIASNRGANMQRIGQVEAGEVTDLSFEENGDSIVFLHHHPDGTSEVHRYTFSTTLLDSIPTTAGEVVEHLVASSADQGALAWDTTHSTQSSALFVQHDLSAAPVQVAVPTDSVVQPLSWLPDHRLLFSSAAPPAALDAPYDLWEWAGGRSTHVIDGVSAAAARTPHGPYLELNIIQGSGFG